jgi:hypothetical protein
LRFGQAGLKFDVPFRSSEEIPKQKPLHFITGYALWTTLNYSLRFGQAGLKFDVP